MKTKHIISGLLAILTSVFTCWGQTQPPVEPASKYTDANGNLDWRKVFDRNQDPGQPAGYISPADWSIMVQYAQWFFSNQPSNPVPVTGACCTPAGTCTVTTQAGCAGSWLGAGTSCTANPCTVTPPASGWTDLTPPAGAMVFYVSSSTGNDAAAGSQAAPFKTLKKAASMLRNGQPDQMLLKKGDTWTEQLSDDGGAWHKSGPASGAKMVVGSYGTGARPIIQTVSGSEAILKRFLGPADSSGRIVFAGIHFKAAPGRLYQVPGVMWLDANQQGGAQPLFTAWDVLFEDCRFTQLFRGMEVQNVNGLTVRRCIFEDICSTTGAGFSPDHCYTGFCTNILIEENYVVMRSFATGGSQFVRNPYQQDVFFYIQDNNTGTNTMRRNLILNKGTQGPVGIEIRSHANVTDNVLDGCHTAISIGSQDTPPSGYFPQGSHATVTGNVVLRGVNLTNQAGGERAIGIHFGFSDTVGTLIARNIVSSKGVSAEDGTAIRGDQYYFQGFARNLTVEDNDCYNWAGFDVNPGTVSNVVVRNNRFQTQGTAGADMPLVDLDHAAGTTFGGNTYFSTRPTGQWFAVGGSFKSQPQWSATEPGAAYARVNYADPGRSIASYAGMVGQAATIDGAMAAVLNQSRDTWDDRWGIDAVLAYFRGGFGR